MGSILQLLSLVVHCEPLRAVSTLHIAALGVPSVTIRGLRLGEGIVERLFVLPRLLPVVFPLLPGLIEEMGLVFQQMLDSLDGQGSHSLVLVVLFLQTSFFFCGLHGPGDLQCRLLCIRHSISQRPFSLEHVLELCRRDGQNPDAAPLIQGDEVIQS